MVLSTKWRLQPTRPWRSARACNACSVASHLLYEPHEGELDIFTKRAIVMLAHLCLGARRAGEPPLPYVSRLVHMGLPAAVEQIYRLAPDGPYLATQILDKDYPSAKKENFKDEFLQS